MERRKVHINQLPNEILRLIFTYLARLGERKTLSMVSKRWDYLVFDFRLLGRTQLKLAIWDKEDIEELPKFTRNYRNVWCDFNFELNKEEVKKLLMRCERPFASVEALICINPAKKISAVNFFSICPSVKKLMLSNKWQASDDTIPVLENLEELDVGDISKSGQPNIIRWAPNLRKLTVSNELHDLPVLIQKLSLEYLRVRYARNGIEVFRKCPNAIKLSSVSTQFIDQKELEELCRVCPLLTTLRIDHGLVTSFQCLTSLAHLKILSFAVNELCPIDGVYLPTVEILKFNRNALPSHKKTLHFDSSWQRAFRNVHYLKFKCDELPTGTVSESFPHLRTLEISACKAAALYDLMEGLSELRELIVHKEPELSPFHLPPLIKLQQLKLVNSELKVTDEAANNLPNLQFVNLFGESECTGAEKLPPRCTVRRYLDNPFNILFDVV